MRFSRPDITGDSFHALSPTVRHIVSGQFPNKVNLEMGVISFVWLSKYVFLRRIQMMPTVVMRKIDCHYQCTDNRHMIIRSRVEVKDEPHG